MKDWHQSLPPEVLDMLRMSHDKLNDFAEATARLEALSKLSFRRAVESVAQEQKEQGAEAWGEGEDERAFEKAQWREKKTSGRISLAISAHKELVKAKMSRLEALDKYEKAEDAPKPALIQFSAKMPQPHEAVERLIHMGRLTEARRNAKVLGIEHEFDWEDVPT